MESNNAMGDFLMPFYPSQTSLRTKAYNVIAAQEFQLNRTPVLPWKGRDLEY